MCYTILMSADPLIEYTLEPRTGKLSYEVYWRLVQFVASA